MNPNFDDYDLYYNVVLNSCKLRIDFVSTTVYQTVIILIGGEKSNFFETKSFRFDYFPKEFQVIFFFFFNKNIRIFIIIIIILSSSISNSIFFFLRYNTRTSRIVLCYIKKIKVFYVLCSSVILLESKRVYR